MIGRLSKFIDSLNVSVRQFELSIRASNGLIRKAIANQTDIQSKWITVIAENYPQLNLDWLFTGKGEMLKSTVPAVTHHTTEAPQTADQAIALYDFPRGNLAGFFTNLPQPVDKFMIPNMPKCDGAVYMRGETMRPALNGGDIALYKQINVNLDNILFGNMYLLSFEVDDDEHIVINYIQPSESADSIKLVNENSYYPPMDIPVSAVKAMAIIKASIRYNTMS